MGTTNCTLCVVCCPEKRESFSPPKAMQFTGQSEEVTGMEESGVLEGPVFGWGRTERVGEAHTAAWPRGQSPAGPHLPGQGPAAAPGAGKQCSSELETSLKILFALTLRNSLEFCFLDLIPRVRFLESLTQNLCLAVRGQEGRETICFSFSFFAAESSGKQPCDPPRRHS